MQKPSMETDTPDLHHQLQILQTDFFVPDVITEATQMMFLLESPHIQELKYGAPVSGPSGGTMSKHLFGDEFSRFPLGRLVKQNVDHAVHRPRLDAIGLMNVCNVPMQGNAYGNSIIRREAAQLIEIFEYIRSNNQVDSYTQKKYNLGQELVLQDFQRRLSALRHQRLILIPCGRFAQKFFRLAQVSSPNWMVIEEVPHPSYNSWDRPRYEKPVQQIKAVFRRL